MLRTKLTGAEYAERNPPCQVCGEPIYRRVSGHLVHLNPPQPPHQAKEPTK